VTLRIIVPHRGLAAAKSRLATVLDPSHREALARQLLEHVLDVLREAGEGETEVISPDPELRPIVEACGARLSVQRGLGLNAGLEQARASALTDGVQTLLVLHGDLPDLAADDLRADTGRAPGLRAVHQCPGPDCQAGQGRLKRRNKTLSYRA
jgi:2-phospho-L-lactate/phosphoenolpyruvate guanylyltransferase